MEDLHAISELATIVFVGVISAYICVRLKLPTTIGYLAAGVLVGLFASDLGHSEFVENAAQLGAALLLFTIGLEFSLDSIRNVFKIAVWGAILQGAGTVLISLLLLPLIQVSEYEAFFIGVIVSMSSTAFVVKLLEGRGEANSRHGKIMLGWLVTQDVMIVVWFFLLSAFAPNQSTTPDLFSAILRTVLLISLTVLVGKYLLPPLLSKVAVSKSDELLLVTTVGVVVLFAVFANFLGISFTIGAFLAGLAMSESIVNHEMFAEIKPIRNLLMLIFFVSIGILLNPKIVGENMGMLIFILLLLIPVKVIITVVINLWFKVHIKNALRIGLGISQIGEFAFLAAQIALAAGWIGSNKKLYSIIVAAAIITMAATPAMYAQADRLYTILDRRLRGLAPNLHRGLFLSMDSSEINEYEQTDIIVCGFGRVGNYVVNALEVSGIPFVGIELDASIAQQLTSSLTNPHSKIIYGDAANPEILRKAGVEKASVLVVALPQSADTTLLIKTVKEINPHIKIIARVHKQLKQASELGADHIIEPEFEAALQIIMALYKTIHRGHKRAVEVVKDFKRQELSA